MASLESANPAFGSQPLISPSFIWKTAAVAAALALLTVFLKLAGYWYGNSIVTSGFSADTTVRTITIGSDTLRLADNMIRFEEQRRDGTGARLDLYVLWPSLEGYSEESRDLFNGADGSQNIVFVTVTSREMPMDMSARFGPIYSGLVETPGSPQPYGLTRFNFQSSTRYAGETLYVETNTPVPFVARCIDPSDLPEGSRTCMRDFQSGKGISVLYRFSEDLLPQWRALEDAMNFYMASTIAGGPGSRSQRVVQ